MTETRKLAAIMFTDIMGYTALMSKDEQKALAVLEINRDMQTSLAKNYNGEFLKEMGDGTMLCFQSALDAVHCAMEIQKSAIELEINLRIGIHLGDIVFKDGDIFGDGVNVAARIEPLAKKGGICVSDEVYKTIHNHSGIYAEYMGEKQLKNVKHLLKIYAISDQEIMKAEGIPEIVPKVIEENSIVVLPFDNISGDPEQEYFSDGLTEEIITDLSYIHKMRVISRTSAMVYKGTKKNIKSIGEELNVKYVLEGSVRKAGNNVRIVAQLINAPTDAHVWAEKFSGTLDDIFDIQEKVSRSITDALRVKISPEESEKILHRPIDNPQALESHMRAQQELWKYTEDSFQRAINYLNAGIEIIGDNATLYAGLAYAYWFYHDYGIIPDPSCIDKAEEYVKKVFELEPNSASGHRINGLIKLKQNTISESYTSLKKAYQLDPNDPNTLLWYAYLIGEHFGRPDEMKHLADKLLEIDPLSPVNQGVIALYYWYSGEFELALECYRKWWKMHPDNLMAGFYLVRHLAMNNKMDECLALVSTFEKNAPGHVFTIFCQFLKYSIEGNKAKAEEIIPIEIRSSCYGDFHITSFFMDCYALLNEKEIAIDWLEHSVKKGWINYPYFNDIDPFLENIRGEERFKKIMEKVRHEWENFEL